MRVEYGSVEKDGSGDLDADWLDVGWVALLGSWMAEAEQAGVAEPNAMVVGTVDSGGRPVTRTVLCKSVDDSGISFYTNYDSDKGEQLAANPYASATFPWYSLGRQVHIRGPVTKVSADATAAYWANRPRGSQLGAWASLQSRPIDSRAALLRAVGRCHRAVRRRGRGPGAAALGRLPDRPRNGRVLAGTGEPGAQQDSRSRLARRTPAAVAVPGRLPRARGRLLADTTPLRTPDFRRLWLAGIVTVIGANLTVFAVPVQLYALTQNSLYVGLSGLFALVPLVVFGLWGGAWADAMDRRLLLIITSCGLGAASVLLWLQSALALDNVWVVLCLLSVQQAFFAVNSPTRAAAIPRMLPGDQLPAANALNMTVMQFGAIVGPLLAGLMLHWVDLSTLYLIDAITCLAPIVATWRLAPIPPSATGEDASGWGLGAVLAGFRYLAGNQVVLMSFVVDLIAMIFGMPRALFPQMAHESFGGPVEGSTTMALLAAAMSAGAVAGGLFSGWLPRIRRQGLAVVIAIVVWGVAMVGFGAGQRAGARRGRHHAVDRVGVPGRGWGRRHGVGGVPVDHPAAGGFRRAAGPTAGRVHRGGGGWTRLADTAHGVAAAAVGTTSRRPAGERSWWSVW